MACWRWRSKRLAAWWAVGDFLVSGMGFRADGAWVGVVVPGAVLGAGAGAGMMGWERNQSSVPSRQRQEAENDPRVRGWHWGDERAARTILAKLGAAESDGFPCSGMMR
jgi:uncharacterized membrane protein YebE (DUF533 family)